MKTPTIEHVIEQAHQFADSGRIWMSGSQNGPAISEAPGRELFRECLAAAVTGDGETCFAAADKLGRWNAAIAHSGPTGIYGVRHLCAAIWYKANGRVEDYERLLRVSSTDFANRLNY